MEIDSSIPAAEGTTAPTPKKKFVPPIYSATGDLLPEGIVYLRLLLILANLDAGRVVEVCFFFYSFQKRREDKKKSVDQFVRQETLQWRLQT